MRKTFTHINIIIFNIKLDMEMLWILSENQECGSLIDCDEDYENKRWLDKGLHIDFAY